ncbi:MAG: hypothetical protein JJ714_09875 [Acidithiobacillus sp.]|nr:hypothetical protein [Acidithiobacillus sp.]
MLQKLMESVRRLNKEARNELASTFREAGRGIVVALAPAPVNLVMMFLHWDWDKVHPQVVWASFVGTVVLAVGYFSFRLAAVFVLNETVKGKRKPKPKPKP